MTRNSDCRALLLLGAKISKEYKHWTKDVNVTTLFADKIISRGSHIENASYFRAWFCFVEFGPERLNKVKS